MRECLPVFVHVQYFFFSSSFSLLLLAHQRVKDNELRSFFLLFRSLARSFSHYFISHCVSPIKRTAPSSCIDAYVYVNHLSLHEILTPTDQNLNV